MEERSEAEEHPPESKLRPRVRARRRVWRVGFILLSLLALIPIVWAGWYFVRLGLAAHEAYRSIFVTPAPRTDRATWAPGLPRPTVLPTTIYLPTPPATPTELPAWEGSEPITLLLIGIDTTPERAEEGALPLADAIIVAQVDPVAKRAVMLSIPRDLLVEIPGVGWDRINAAYAYGEANRTGGPVTLRRTVEHNFGVRIDAFAEVDFRGFVQIVDLLGGVVVDVPAPIKDDEFPGADFSYQRLYFAPGLQRFDGARALAYVRTRHDDNDLARGLRQQQVLFALQARAQRIDALRRAPELLAALGNTVRTDLSLRQVLALARLGLELSPEQIETASLAGMVQDATLPSGAAVLVGDWAAIRADIARRFQLTATGTR